MKAHRRAPQADSDLDDIGHYVAPQSGSNETADRLIESLTVRFFLLAKHPHLERSRDHGLRSGLRSFALRNYVIFYRGDRQRATIRVMSSLCS